MTMLKERIVVGAVAFVMGAAGIVGTASAGLTKLYGAGSTLIAPYGREAGDCYGNRTALINRGSSEPTKQTLPYFNFTGSPTFDCNPSNPHGASGHGPANPTVKLFYDGTGSGIGIKGVYGHSGSYAGDIDPGPGVSTFPVIHFGFSDAGLDAFDVGLWNNGGGTYLGDGVTCDTSTTGHVGLCVAAPGSHPPAGSNGIENPSDSYGRLVQFPMLVAPVTIGYDPVYKRIREEDNSVTQYSFHIHSPRGDGSGGLRLDAATYCKIFNGVITDWADPAITTLNGGESVRDPEDPVAEGSWHLPIVLVGRKESSGTTSIWTRHLARVCTILGGSNHYATGTTTLPAELRDGDAQYDKATDTLTGTITEGNYVVADGNDGVAQYVDFRHQPDSTPGSELDWGRIGYLGPDYVLPYVLNTGANNYGINTATLRNHHGSFISPTPAAASTAFKSVLPPQSKPGGAYDPDGAGDRHNAEDWVEGLDPSSVLADPTASTAYPIVGSTNVLLYTCYARKGIWRALVGGNGKRGFFDWYFHSATVNDTVHGLLAEAGLAGLPDKWVRAISQTFINGDKYHLGLTILPAGRGHCKHFHGA